MSVDSRLTRRLLRLLWGSRWGSLRRTTPIRRDFGYGHGEPIDRYYIERFLDAHRLDIKGRVLEIGDAAYTKRFGGDAVTASDVLHATPGNPAATIVGSLVDGTGVPQGRFDCIILTQVLNVVPDVAAAIATVHGALRPGGVALATVAGLTQISRYDMDRWGDYWRFTDRSARTQFEPLFGAGAVQVTAYGNVLAAIALLHGLVQSEVRPDELDEHDPDYQVTIAVRAVRQ